MRRVRWCSGLVIVLGLLGCSSTPPQIDPQPDSEAQPATEPQPPPKREDVATLDDVRAFLGLPELASARAFAINVHTEFSDHEELLVDDIGQLNPDRTPDAGVLLSEAQLAELMRIATGGDGDHMGPAYCFYPHHAVALYDADGAILGELTFCFMCGRMQATIAGLGPDATFKSLAVMLDELDVPRDLPLPGLPPVLGRPSVKRDVDNALRSCNRNFRRGRDGTHGHPALSFAVHVGSDGKVSQIAGLDETSVVGACVIGELGRREYMPTQAGGVHRFEFPAAAALGEEPGAVGP